MFQSVTLCHQIDDAAIQKSRSVLNHLQLFHDPEPGHFGDGNEGYQRKTERLLNRSQQAGDRQTSGKPMINCQRKIATGKIATANQSTRIYRTQQPACSRWTKPTAKDSRQFVYPTMLKRSMNGWMSRKLTFPS